MCVIQAGGNVFVEIIIDADGYIVLASSCNMAAEIIQVRIVVTAGKKNGMWVRPSHSFVSFVPLR